MKPVSRIFLIDKIADAMKNFRTYDIERILDSYGFVYSKMGTTGNRKKYVTWALTGASDQILRTIAEDIGVADPFLAASASSLPYIWHDTNDFRLFISHISDHKHEAIELRECLKPFRIAAFVAHEDIRPTIEWQLQIERALRSMDTLLALHTRGFSQSNWTQQEIGFAVALGIGVISIEMGEIPTGFIAKDQALASHHRAPLDIAEEIVSVLRIGRKTRERYADSLER